MDVLDKMTTFVRVVEAQSITAAARQRRLSPAAVSRQLAALERTLGVTLLARTTRRSALTEAGRAYYERCLRILRDVEDAQTVGAAHQGALRISAPVGFGLGWLVPRLTRFSAKNPHVTLDLKLEDALIDLALEGIDLAVRVGAQPPDSAELIAHPMGSFRRVLVAAPSYLARHGTPKSPEALARHAALVHANATRDQWVLSDGEREVRLRPEPVFRTNALSALQDFLREGRGLTLLPSWLVEDELQRGRLRRVLPQWTTPPVPVLALHRTAQRGAPRIRAFVDHLRAEAADSLGAPPVSRVRHEPPDSGESAPPPVVSSRSASRGRSYPRDDA